MAFAAPPSGRTARSQGVCERGGTPSTGKKAQRSGAFGGWNDLDRVVKWEEGAANEPSFRIRIPNLKPETRILARGVAGVLGNANLHEASARAEFLPSEFVFQNLFFFLTLLA